METIKIHHLESVHLLSHRRHSPWLTPPDGLPPAADLLVHVAGDTAEKRQAVRQSGGVRHHGNADGPRTHELQANCAAPPGPESEGMRKLLCSQLILELPSQHQRLGPSGFYSEGYFLFRLLGVLSKIHCFVIQVKCGRWNACVIFCLCRSL